MIGISYRDEGRGKGAFFDHYTIRKATGYDTRIIKADPISTQDLLDYLTERSANNKQGWPNATVANAYSLPRCSVLDDVGLLYIPGRARNTETKRPHAHRQRTDFEQKLIKKAYLTGQPILAVCAGSWQLWQYLGGEVKVVSDHNYGGGMPRILDNGRIGYNVQIHRIQIDSQHTILSTAMSINDGDSVYPSINSVHWQACDSNILPANVVISATSKQDESLAPNSRKGGKMLPEKDTIEAFETKHGVPIIGIQWHPEAYNANDSKYEPHRHLSILKYMSQAGKTYQHKQLMLKELRENPPQPAMISKNEKKHDKNNHLRIKNCKKKEQDSHKNQLANEPEGMVAPELTSNTMSFFRNKAEAIDLSGLELTQAVKQLEI